MVKPATFLVGWLASWAILAAMAESRTFEPLANTLAVTIAAGTLVTAAPKLIQTLQRSVT